MVETNVVNVQVDLERVEQMLLGNDEIEEFCDFVKFKEIVVG